MNKKIISSALATLMRAGSASFTAFAAMPNGTVKIGNKAFDLSYANDPTNIVEITNAIVAGGEVYVKDFAGNWIHNLTEKSVQASVIPAVIYKSADKQINFDAEDEDHEDIIVVEAVSAINAIDVVYGTEVTNIGLPAKATLKLSNKTTKDVNVTWTSLKYDGAKTASYIFTGVYELPENVTGTMPAVTVDVVVGVNPDLTEVFAAKAVVTALQTAASKDLTVESNLKETEALLQTAKEAVAKVDDETEKVVLGDKVVATEKIVKIARTSFDLEKAVDEKVAEDAAETAVKTAEISRLSAEVIVANKVVEAIKDATKKARFANRIANINILSVLSQENNSFTLTNYNISLNNFISQEVKNTPAAFINGRWCYAFIRNGQPGYFTDMKNPNDSWVNSPTDYNYIKDQLIYNINYLNLQDDPVKVYQFLKLDYIDCTSAAQLDSMFGSNNVLTGKGQVFIDAAKASNINPIYLAAHAILETGYGTSLLANGGTKDSSGNYTYGMPVYNLFGIGAIDSDADACGSTLAYKERWTSIDLAILGGAAWISKGYISKYQNTLYKMRWNPLDIFHQYATGVEWATSQSKIIKKYFDLFPDATLTFDIPVFYQE